MRILKSLSSVFCTLLAMVLFSLTISLTMASPKDSSNGLENAISKKGASPTNSASQLPYEEKETEKDDEWQDSFSMVCLLSEPIYFLPTIDQDGWCEKALKPIDLITDIPLYLSQRVLLI